MSAQYVAYICGTVREADQLMHTFSGATGTNMVFTTLHSATDLLGLNVAAYVVTEQAHKLAHESPECRDRLHRMIEYVERHSMRCMYDV